MIYSTFRELPEAVLESSETISRFEQAASTKEVSTRESQLTQLVQQLPECNRVLLGWVTCHLDHVTAREKTTKMNAQSIAMTLSPVLQMSHRLFLALLCHCKALFPEVTLDKYIPPLPAGSLCLPDTPEAIAKELAKQESLLEQIHMQMNAGFVTKSREELLWEVQRIITQLKRKFKTVQKLEGNLQKSLDDEVKSSDENHGDAGPSSAGVGTKILANCSGNSGTNSNSGSSGVSNSGTGVSSSSNLCPGVANSSAGTLGTLGTSGTVTTEPPVVDTKSELPTETKDVVDASEEVKEEENDDLIERLREMLIHDELLNMETVLKMRIQQERNEIKKLNDMIVEKPEILKVKDKERVHSPNEAEITAMIQLAKENQLLEVILFFLFKIKFISIFFIIFYN